MKRLFFVFALSLLLIVSCSQQQQISQCPSHIDYSLQNSSLQVMKEKHVNGVVMVIDSASNVVVSAGILDSMEMTVDEVYGWLSMMLNPGNLFKPMLLAPIIDDDTTNIKLLGREYSTGRICIDGVGIHDHGYGDYAGSGKMNVQKALHSGSNVAWCDFVSNVYPAESRVALEKRILPQGIPFQITGLIGQSPQDFYRYCMGYGSLLQPYTVAFFYHALLKNGRFRLVSDDCSYRYESVCSEQAAKKVVDLLLDQTTGRVGIHGTLMDSTNSYPTYIGYSPDLQYTVMVMLDHKSNTNVAMRVFDSIVSHLK